MKIGECLIRGLMLHSIIERALAVCQIIAVLKEKKSANERSLLLIFQILIWSDTRGSNS